MEHLKWGLLAAGNIAGKFAKGLATIKDQATAHAVASRDPEKAAIPVIGFTAREHARGHQKSAEMGAADYFRKPFEPDELIELVNRHVGQQV